MHPNPVFRKTSRQKNIDFAQERSFGLLSVNSQFAPLISHVPFQLSPDGNYLEAHLARINPIVQLLNQPVEALMAVSGGDAYISPDWYGIKNQVPTWNYIAVHLSGTLKRLEQKELRGVLDRLSENMEDRLKPKRPWAINKMDDDAYSSLSMQIVPIAMEITSIEGSWKLSQNKTRSAQVAVSNEILNAEIGLQVDQIARLMSNEATE